MTRIASQCIAIAVFFVVLNAGTVRIHAKLDNDISATAFVATELIAAIFAPG
jgi:hypothetical protein